MRAQVLHAILQRGITDPSQLEDLSGRELELPARVLGVPHSGTKPALRQRCLTAYRLRVLLKDMTDPHELTVQFSKRDLQGWTRSMHLWSSGTKVHLAATLLGWRNQARVDGQKAWTEVEQEARRLRRKEAVFAQARRFLLANPPPALPSTYIDAALQRLRPPLLERIDAALSAHDAMQARGG